MLSIRVASTPASRRARMRIPTTLNFCRGSLRTLQSGFPSTLFGLYGQDEWHARSNLTVTLALRAEHRSNPVCKQSCFARLAGNFSSLSHDPAQPYNQAILANQKQAFAGIDNILWAPRFSFAWQPFGVEHDTVIRGGIGIFYDPVSGNHTVTLSNNPPLFNSYSVFGDNLAPDENTSLFKDAAASNAAFLDGFASGLTLAQIQARFSSFYPPGFTPPGITNPSDTDARAAIPAMEPGITTGFWRPHLRERRLFRQSRESRTGAESQRQCI